MAPLWSVAHFVSATQIQRTIMDLSKIATITIAYESFQDLLHERTGNPIANEEIPEMLKSALQSGVTVLLTDVEGRNSRELMVDDKGRFHYQ
jgi:hypothetical protein